VSLPQSPPIGEDGGMRLPSGIAKRLGPLNDAPFRLYWIGQGTSAIGDALVPLAIAFAVLGLGGGAGGIGLVLTAFSIPRLLFILAGGVWADRLPRQRVMLAADVVRGLVELAMAGLLLSGTAVLWELAAGAAVVGGASAFFVPAASGLLPQVLAPRYLQQGNALMSLSRSATGLIGPSVSGLLVATVGVGWVFVIDAATFAISAFSLLRLHVPRPPLTAPRLPFTAELAAGWREVTSRRWLITSIAIFGVSNVCQGPFFVLGPVVAQSSLGGATSWGLIATAQAAGALLGGVIALRWQPAHPLATGFVLGPLFFVPLLLLAGPAPVPFIMLAALASLAVAELTNTWWYTVLQQRIPEQALSRVSSYDWLVSLIFQPVGFIVVGPVAAIVGTTTTLVGAAVLGTSANLGSLLSSSIRGIGWAAPPAPAAGSRAEGPVAGPIEVE
jgi:MFS family permease